METPGDYFLTRRLTRHNLLRVFRQHGIYYKVILAEGAEHSAEVEPLWMLFSFYDQSVGGVQGTLGSLLDVDGNIWTEALSHCSDLILNDDRVYPGSCLLCQLWCVNPGFNTVVPKVGWGGLDFSKEIVLDRRRKRKHSMASRFMVSEKDYMNIIGVIMEESKDKVTMICCPDVGETRSKVISRQTIAW